MPENYAGIRSQTQALEDVGDMYDECMPADVNNGIDGGSISLRSPGGSIHTVDYEHPTEE